MKRRTKIVCTLGPATSTRDQIKKLIDAGMNVARLNCSHGDWEAKAEWIQWIREIAPDTNTVAILADLQGPKFRIGALPEGFLDVHQGQTLTISQQSSSQLCVPGDEIYQAMETGDRLLMGDGDVELKLGAKVDGEFTAKVQSTGRIKSKQGVTLVGKSFDVPAMTDKDLKDLYEAAKLGVDVVALSYVRRASDIRELRRILDTYDPSIKVCAKIETREALKEIDDIIRVSDIIMVARGDLGLQMDLEEVPIAQKHIISRCGRFGKPVITATQMLESMIQIARPTRAEATDVANAIVDGTDAVMLSGETAAGAYPIEAVRMMARIADRAESIVDRSARMELEDKNLSGSDLVTEAVAHAAVQLAHTVKAKAIITTSTSGLTPRMVSKFRPKCPILCATWEDRTRAYLSFMSGVTGISIGLPPTTDEVMHAAVNEFLRHKMLKLGDTIVITAGVPAGRVGNTNLIYVETVK
jgi:pyruvate kinase